MLDFFCLLFTPLKYLFIRNTYKIYCDIVFPLIFSIIFICIYTVIPIKLEVFGDKSLFSIVTDLLQLLIGFFIASLAAIATFQKEDMDESIDGEPAKLKRYINNTIVDVSLTRRQFLCFLFGYLSLVSLLLYFIGELANLVHLNNFLVLNNFVIWLNFIFCCLYCFVFMNIITTTMLGLFYLADRIHRG